MFLNGIVKERFFKWLEDVKYKRGKGIEQYSGISKKQLVKDCLRKQEKILKVDFEQDMAGKKLKKGSYQDKNWFIGRSGSYLFLFHKGYVKQVSSIERIGKYSMVEFETIDGEYIEVRCPNSELRPLREFVRWSK